jgi:hypothetical protein
MSDAPPKSSYEIAMERLRKRDGESQGEAIQTLSDAQKAAIAEVRQIYAARLAEEEILHQSKVRSLTDPTERETMDQQFRRERERLSSERDTKIERIRRGDST